MGETRGPELRAVVATFVSCAFVTVVLRMWVRLRIVKAFGYDDAWMVLAMLSHIMFAACAIGGVRWGTGQHMSDLSGEAISKAMRYWWLCYIAYCWSMIAAKISIGLFLLRVTVKKTHKWIIYIAMGLTVLTGLVFFFVTLLQCRPISYFWDKTNENGSCVSVDIIIALTFLYSAISVISDFTFAILPMFLVWGLNMSVRTRVVLIPILGMGCVASVAVVVRLAYVMDFKNPDFLWATVDIAIWSDIEQGLAIAAGSLATLRPLFRQISAKIGFSSTATPFGDSKPSKPVAGRRTPQWNPRLGNESQNNSSIFSLKNPFRRPERSMATDKDQEYTMGDLTPIRLRDDVAEENLSEKSENGFNTWRIHTGKISDEECRAGTITMHSEIHQKVDRL